MNTHLIGSSTSGIPEGMESAMSTDSLVIITAPVFACAIWLPLLLVYVIERKTSFMDDSPLFVFVVAFLFGCIILVSGLLITHNVAENSRKDLDAAVVQNLEEKLGLQEVSTEVVGTYNKDNHRVAVSGSPNGHFIEFEALYSAEHDAMLPVKTNVDITTEGSSELEKILNE